MRVEMVRSGLVDMMGYGTMTIVAGADVPKNKVVETPIFLVDCFPSIVEAVGGHLVEEDRDLPGKSIWEIAQASNQDRFAFSEYHAVGSENAIYMLRDRRYKIFTMLMTPHNSLIYRLIQRRNRICRIYLSTKRYSETLIENFAISLILKQLMLQLKRIRGQGFSRMVEK